MLQDLHEVRTQRHPQALHEYLTQEQLHDLHEGLTQQHPQALHSTSRRSSESSAEYARPPVETAAKETRVSINQ